MVSKGYCKAGTVVKVTFFFNKYNNWNKIEGGEDHSHLPAFKGGRVEARWNDGKLWYNPALEHKAGSTCVQKCSFYSY